MPAFEQCDSAWTILRMGLFRKQKRLLMSLLSEVWRRSQMARSYSPCDGELRALKSRHDYLHWGLA